ncbi:pleckstrin-like proteiny domain-containing family G member 3-like [Sesbania bispinosa]|nr:pleckstrin-like proteiny domain-containing family G member 3-like [Sesbania bispinosa]
MGSRGKSFSSHSVSGRRYCKCGDEIVILTSGSAKIQEGSSSGALIGRYHVIVICSNGLMKLKEAKVNPVVEGNATV